MPTSPSGPEATGHTNPGPGVPVLVDALAAVPALRPQMHETVREPLVQVVVGLLFLVAAARIGRTATA